MARRTTRITNLSQGTVGKENEVENAYSPSTGVMAFMEQVNFHISQSQKLYFRTGSKDNGDIAGAVNVFAIDSNSLSPLLAVFFDREIRIFGQNVIGGDFVQKYTLVSPYNAAESIKLSFSLLGDFLFMGCGFSNHYPYYIDLGQGTPVIARLDDSSKRIFISKANRPFLRPRSSIVTSFIVRILGQNEVDPLNITVDIKFLHIDNPTTIFPNFQFQPGELLAIQGLLLDDANKNGYMVLEIVSGSEPESGFNTRYLCKFIIIHSTSPSTSTSISKDFSGYYKPSNITVVTDKNSNPIGNKDYPLWLIQGWTGTPAEVALNPLKSAYPKKVEKVANRLVFGSYSGAFGLSEDNNPFSFKVGIKATDGFVGYINFDYGVNDPITNIFTVLYDGNPSLVISNGRQSKISTIGGSGIDITQLNFSGINVFEGGVSEMPVTSVVSDTSFVYIDRTKTKIMVSMYNDITHSFQPINMSQKNSDLMIGKDGEITTIKKIGLSTSFLNIFYFAKEDGTIACFLLEKGQQNDLSRALWTIDIGLSGNANLTYKVLNIAAMDVKNADAYDNILWAIVEITDASVPITYTRLLSFRQKPYSTNRFIDDGEFLDFTTILTNAVSAKQFSGAPVYMRNKVVHYYDYTNKIRGNTTVDSTGNVVVLKDSLKIAIGFVYEGYLETVHLHDPEYSGIANNSIIDGVEVGVAYTKKVPQAGFSSLNGIVEELILTDPKQNIIEKGDKNFYKNALLVYRLSNNATDNLNGINSLIIKHSGGTQMNIISLMVGIDTDK